MSNLFYRALLRLPSVGGGCPQWIGNPLTVNTTPLTKWNRTTSMYATNEALTLGFGSILRVAYCQTRPNGSELTLAISPDGAFSDLVNFQTDNNFVIERYNGASSWNGVLAGEGTSTQLMGGINGIDLTIAVGAGSNGIKARSNPGTSYQFTEIVSDNSFSLIGSTNKMYIGPGTNGLAAVQAIKYAIDPPRLTPTIVQSASLRGDGTLALGSAPTPGNLLIFINAGFSGSENSYVPSGFSRVTNYDGDANNRVACYSRIAQSGDTGSYAMSASDNQGCTVIEVANADFVVARGGGSMASKFTGTSFSVPIAATAYDATSINILAMEQDGTGVFTVTPATGLTTRYITTSDGNNHVGGVVTLTNAFSGNVTGSVASGPSGSTYGQWMIFGRTTY